MWLRLKVRGGGRDSRVERIRLYGERGNNNSLQGTSEKTGTHITLAGTGLLAALVGILLMVLAACLMVCRHGSASHITTHRHTRHHRQGHGHRQ